MDLRKKNIYNYWWETIQQNPYYNQYLTIEALENTKVYPLDFANASLMNEAHKWEECYGTPWPVTQGDQIETYSGCSVSYMSTSEETSSFTIGEGETLSVDLAWNYTTLEQIDEQSQNPEIHWSIKANVSAQKDENGSWIDYQNFSIEETARHYANGIDYEGGKHYLPIISEPGTYKFVLTITTKNISSTNSPYDLRATIASVTNVQKKAGAPLILSTDFGEYKNYSKPGLYYSINNGKWVEYDGENLDDGGIEVSVGDKIRWKRDTNITVKANWEEEVFPTCADLELMFAVGKKSSIDQTVSFLKEKIEWRQFNVYGNILSLIYSDDFCKYTKIEPHNCIDYTKLPTTYTEMVNLYGINNAQRLCSDDSDWYVCINNTINSDVNESYYQDYYNTIVYQANKNGQEINWTEFRAKLTSNSEAFELEGSPQKQVSIDNILFYCDHPCQWYWGWDVLPNRLCFSNTSPVNEFNYFQFLFGEINANVYLENQTPIILNASTGQIHTFQLANYYDSQNNIDVIGFAWNGYISHNDSIYDDYFDYMHDGDFINDIRFDEHYIPEIFTGGVFAGLFAYNRGLIQASNMIIPLRETPPSCFVGTFMGCNSLESIPNMAPSIVSASCYAGMFEDCYSLNSEIIIPEPIDVITGKDLESIPPNEYRYYEISSLPEYVYNCGSYMQMFHGVGNPVKNNENLNVIMEATLNKNVIANVYNILLYVSQGCITKGDKGYSWMMTCDEKWDLVQAAVEVAGLPKDKCKVLLPWEEFDIDYGNSTITHVNYDLDSEDEFDISSNSMSIFNLSDEVKQCLLDLVGSYDEIENFNDYFIDPLKYFAQKPLTFKAIDTCEFQWTAQTNFGKNLLIDDEKFKFYNDWEKIDGSNSKLEFSLDNGKSWQKYCGGVIVPAGQSIQWKAVGNSQGSDGPIYSRYSFRPILNQSIVGYLENYYKEKISQYLIPDMYHSEKANCPVNYLPVYQKGRFEILGNINSLIYDDFETRTEMSYPYEYCFMFTKTDVVSAKNLVLPCTKTTHGCYDSMFRHCGSLVYGPSLLPAKHLRDDYGIYSHMFTLCKSLITSPNILVRSTYDFESKGDESEDIFTRMFAGCEALENAPYIRVKYIQMPYSFERGGHSYFPKTIFNGIFAGCSNLKYLKMDTRIDPTMRRQTDGSIIDTWIPINPDQFGGDSGVPKGYGGTEFLWHRYVDVQKLHPCPIVEEDSAHPNRLMDEVQKEQYLIYRNTIDDAKLVDTMIDSNNFYIGDLTMVPARWMLGYSYKELKKMEGEGWKIEDTHILGANSPEVKDTIVVSLFLKTMNYKNDRSIYTFGLLSYPTVDGTISDAQHEIFLPIETTISIPNGLKLIRCSCENSYFAKHLNSNCKLYWQKSSTQNQDGYTMYDIKITDEKDANTNSKATGVTGVVGTLLDITIQLENLTTPEETQFTISVGEVLAGGEDISIDDQSKTYKTVGVKISNGRIVPIQGHSDDIDFSNMNFPMAGIYVDYNKQCHSKNGLFQWRVDGEVKNQNSKFNWVTDETSYGFFNNLYNSSRLSGYTRGMLPGFNEFSTLQFGFGGAPYYEGSGSPGIFWKRGNLFPSTWRIESFGGDVNIEHSLPICLKFGEVANLATTHKNGTDVYECVKLPELITWIKLNQKSYPCYCEESSSYTYNAERDIPNMYNFITWNTQLILKDKYGYDMPKQIYSKVDDEHERVFYIKPPFYEEGYGWVEDENGVIVKANNTPSKASDSLIFLDSYHSISNTVLSIIRESQLN